MAGMTKGNSPGRRRRWLRLAGGTTAAILLVLIGSAWMAYRHIPTWYRPAYVPVEDEQQARDELGAAFTELSRGMGQNRTFDFIVRQDQLNRWLVARDRIWPESKRWIPEQIEDPMIVFQTGEVLLAGLWQGPGPRTVVNIRLRLEMENGKVRTRVLSVRGGSLPFPLGPIEREIERLERHRAERDEPLLPDGASIVQAMEGAPLSLEIPWSQPKGKFQIEALEVRPESLFVRLRPVQRVRTR
jgi:hypothetical protein